jgi:hypothetical protein
MIPVALAPLLTALKVPFTFWQSPKAETVCADENRPMASAANADVASILSLRYMIFSCV